MLACPRTLALPLGLVLLAALQSCGGGGAGGVGGGPPVTVTPGNLLMSMPPNPYPAGSADARNFAEINRIRIAGGFGAITEHPAMTLAARNHNNYEVVNIMAGNPVPDPHLETPGLPGFTGVTPGDRCTAAAKDMSKDNFVACGEVRYGFGGSIDDMNVMGGYGATLGHLQIILDYRKNRGGLSLIDDPIPSNWHPWGHGSFGTIDVGYVLGNEGRVASDNVNSVVGVYPFDGMTGVGVGYTDPTCDDQGNALDWPGHYCNPGLTIAAQTTLLDTNPEVIAFSVRREGATTDVPTRRIIAGEPCCGPGTEPSYPGWALLATTALLESNAKYVVTLKLRINGVAADKTWSFTTGNTMFGRLGG